MRFKVFGLGLAMLVLAADLQADPRLSRSTTLELFTRTSPHLRDASTGIEYPLEKTTRFLVRRDVAVVLAVADANPLLFEYSSTTRFEEAPSFTAAAAFGQSIAKLLGLFPGTLAADARALKVDGVAPEEVIKALAALAAHIESMPEYLRLSIGGASDVAALKAAVLGVNTRGLPDLIDKLYGQLFDLAQKCLQEPGAALSIDGRIPADCSTPLDLTFAVDLANQQQRLGRALAERDSATGERDRRLLRRQAATAARDLAVSNRSAAAGLAGKTPKDAKLAAARDAAEALVKEAQQTLDAATAAFEQIETALQKIGAQVETARASLRAAESALEHAKETGPTLRDFLSLTLSIDTRIAKQVQLLREVIKDVEGVNAPPSPLTTHAYSAKDITTTTVTVAAKAKYQSFMDGTVKAYQQKHARSFDIVTDAYRPVHFAPGVGFVLGFVPNPTFTAVKDGDTFKIVKAEEDLTRYNVAAMLHIIPDQWREPTFGGFFQLGITPQKDDFGFYFGAGIQAQTVFTFGAGLMLQQTRRLAPGLDLSSRLASAAELKTETDFKPGLYLHATVSLPQKKN